MPDIDLIIGERVERALHNWAIRRALRYGIDDVKHRIDGQRAIEIERAMRDCNGESANV